MMLPFFKGTALNLVSHFNLTLNVDIDHSYFFLID